MDKKYVMKQASIYKDLKFKEDKPVITVLFDTEFTKEIRIAMFKDVRMKEHKTPYPIVVEVVDGNISFGVNNEVLKLTKGDLISLEGNVTHDLLALSNSIVRLTLTKNDKVKRVENVIESK